MISLPSLQLPLNGSRLVAIHTFIYVHIEGSTSFVTFGYQYFLDIKL